MPSPLIIYDFGANNGDDIAYYLHKADLVVAVEANPALCEVIRRRYAAEIAAGRVVVENVVVVPAGQPPVVPFFVHTTAHVVSQFGPPPAAKAGKFLETRLPATRAAALVARYGPPHYVKIDLEGLDAVVLRDLFEAGIRPDYISAECHEIDAFTLLAVAGYDAFKLVDGASVPTRFANHPIATRVGPRVHTFPKHTAGPFGNDIPGPWLTKNEIFKQLAEVGLGWRDMHASRVDRPAAAAEPTHEPTHETGHPAAPRPAEVQVAEAFGIAAAPPGSLRLIGIGSCTDVSKMPRSFEGSRQGVIAGEVCMTLEPFQYLAADGRPLQAPVISRVRRDVPADTPDRDAAAAATLPEIVHEEPALLLACTWHHAFYHFLYDALGKLAVAEQHGLTSRTHAVYFNAREQWQRDAFHLLGIEPRSLAEGVRHRFTRAALPSCYCTVGGPPPRELIYFLRRFRDPRGDTDPPAKLFLSRGVKSHGRQLLNEQALYERCFQPRGYRFVDPGQMTFDEQRRLFSAATHFAGPHGAAFSLICLARTPPTVIEFHSPQYFVRLYGRITHNMHGRYAAFNARRGFFQPPTWKADFSLDLDAAARWVDSLAADGR